MSDRLKVIATDVLVIGAGGAGLRAAVAAFDAGAEVRMIFNGRLGRSGSTTFPVAELAGFQASDGCNPEDTPERHYGDIMAAALGMCDPGLARIASMESPVALKELESLGVEFMPGEGCKHLIGVSCFSTSSRSHRILGHGEPIARVLSSEVQKRGIPFDEKSMVASLIVKAGACVGAIALDENDKLVIYEAKAVVLATGGAGRLFRMNINPTDVNGSSYALALAAGAKLVNLEFMQAGVAVKKPVGLLAGWVWSYGPKLVDQHGEEFLTHYLPPGVTEKACFHDKSKHFPFSSRDNSKYVEVAIFGEQQKGNQVFLDFRDIADREGFCERPLYPWLKKRGLDPLAALTEIGVYAQAVNGGVKIDEHGASTVPGLFAAGEAAGGPHGADRLGGGMLSVSQVFGKRAGTAAAQFAQHKLAPELVPEDYNLQIAELDDVREDGEATLEDVQRRLQATMYDNLVIERTAAKLAQARREVLELKNLVQNDLNIKDASQVRDLINVKHLLSVAEMIIGAASLRKESRGSHYRTDYPDCDEAFSSVIYISKSNGFELAPK
jgi:fumarate reductase (CoM/CoB) subunit A